MVMFITRSSLSYRLEWYSWTFSLCELISYGGFIFYFIIIFFESIFYFIIFFFK
jgi:hypothetical protein